MPNKLKNLSVTSVDLVDQGANPDAHVRLFKRKEDEPEADPDVGLFQKFANWMAKGFYAAVGAAPDEGTVVDNVEKEAQTFGENLSREQLRHVTSEMFDCCYALSDSLCSILCDDELTTEKKQGMMLQSLDEFTATVKGAVGAWSAGNQMEKQTTEAGIQKSTAQQEALAKLLGQHNLGDEPTEPPSGGTEQEVTETMRIDKSKMTPEEAATLAEFEKKYGVADDPAPGGDPAPQDGVAKGTEPAPTPSPAPAGTQTPTPTPAPSGELHPEVAKALADFQEMNKRRDAEVEELKKSLEIERLTAIAKKYEVLGKKAPELAAKLYELKKAGGTVYDDYVALLDENLTALTKGGLFGEIGSSRQGSAGTTQSIGIKAAELAKAAGGALSGPDAIIKAFEENPELAAQYEAEYFGR